MDWNGGKGQKGNAAGAVAMPDNVRRSTSRCMDLNEIRPRQQGGERGERGGGGKEFVLQSVNTHAL